MRNHPKAAVPSRGRSSLVLLATVLAVVIPFALPVYAGYHGEYPPHALEALAITAGVTFTGGIAWVLYALFGAQDKSTKNAVRIPLIMYGVCIGLPAIALNMTIFYYLGYGANWVLH